MWLLSGLCGFTHFYYCGLNVDYVDSLISTIFYVDYLRLLWICTKSMFLKSTCDMVLMCGFMWIQYQYIHQKVNQAYRLNQTLEVEARNEQILLQKDTLQAIKYGFASAVINSLAFAVHQEYLSCYYTKLPTDINIFCEL